MHPDDNGRAVEPVDYAKLNAIYAGLLVAVLAGTRNRPGAREPIPARELVPLGAATFALAKLVAREKIGTWMREPFVEHDGSERRPRGTRLQHAVGELVTCTRCVGAWSALAVVALRVADPQSGRLVTNVLAASAMNDWLQVGFRALCSESNALDRRVSERRPDPAPQS